MDIFTALIAQISLLLATLAGISTGTPIVAPEEASVIAIVSQDNTAPDEDDHTIAAEGTATPISATPDVVPTVPPVSSSVTVTAIVLPSPVPELAYPGALATTPSETKPPAWCEYSYPISGRGALLMPIKNGITATHVSLETCSIAEADETIAQFREFLAAEQTDAKEFISGKGEFTAPSTGCFINNRTTGPVVAVRCLK